MPIGNRRKSGNHNPDFRISRPKRIDQFNVIFHKEITIIGPITGICIIDAQMNNHNISGEVDRSAKLILLHVRPVPFIQQGSTRFAEVFDLIRLSQHLL